jgi:hypothetical protein
MTKQLPITILILAHQQNALFDNCLQSVSWADEILVGWNGEGKIDKKQLSEKFPQLHVVYLPEPITDFAATRNELQKKATNDWVFWLDSDEVITKESVEVIEKLLSQKNVDGYFVHRQDVFYGHVMQWGEVKDVRILRLFRKSKGAFVRPVHEVAEGDGEIQTSGITLLHYAHQSVTSFYQKVARYAKIEADYRHQQKQKTNTVELVIWPAGKFLANYFMFAGFLDGWQGLTYAVMMSLHSLLVRAFLLEKTHAATTAH